MDKLSTLIQVIFTGMLFQISGLQISVTKQLNLVHKAAKSPNIISLYVCLVGDGKGGPWSLQVYR